MFNQLFFTTGPATLVPPSYINFFEQPPGIMEGVKLIQVNEDHRLFLRGEFGGFRIYMLVTHPIVEIIPDTVKLISDTHFIASLKLELSPGVMSEHKVIFRAPILPFYNVRATEYGIFPDAFEFKLPLDRIERFPCNLNFLQEFAENSPVIPLCVRYVGIVKSKQREAHDRLGKGHEKLQMLLAEQTQRLSRQTTSIVLYRPSELIPPLLSFPDVIEIIEATMISYFQSSPLNIRRLNFPSDSPELCSKISSLKVKNVFTRVTAPKNTFLYSKKAQSKIEHDIKIFIP